ncbi:MAG: PEGA domain-containing protein, partial [Bryobacteraceae bacterium]
MIHEDGSAKVTDFGVAKIVSQQMTQAGAMMGTPSYMSPEQVQGTAVDGRADQFSLAVMAYEVLTGEKPFSAEYLPTLLFKIVREDPVPPQRINATLPPVVETVFKKALAKLPADRYDTCVEFVNSLAAACNTNPAWIPLPRGAGQDMPTIATSNSVETMAEPSLYLKAPIEPPKTPVVTDSQSDVRVISSDMIPLNPVAEPTRSLPLPPVFIPPVQATPPPEAVAPVGARREVEALPEPPIPVQRVPREPAAPTPSSGGLVKKLIAVVALVLVLGVGFIVYQRYTDFPETKRPPVETNPTEPVAPPDTKKTTEAKKSTDVRPPEPKKQTEEPVKNPDKSEKKTSQPPVAKEMPLQLASIPPGAEVVVDGNAALTCRTPCNLPLEAGRHTAVIRLNGYREQQKILELPRDANLNLVLVATSGIVNITSAPSGLMVVIEGKDQSAKTPATFSLPVGQYKVKITKEGQSREFSINVKDGTISSHNIDWSQ